MEKILMMTIGTENGKIMVLNIIFIPIICSSSDERDIKHSLESRKNDPRILLAIMTRHLSRTVISNQKAKLDELKDIVEKCDTLTAKFIDVSELAAKMKAQAKDSILHNFNLN